MLIIYLTVIVLLIVVLYKLNKLKLNQNKQDDCINYSDARIKRLLAIIDSQTKLIEAYKKTDDSQQSMISILEDMVASHKRLEELNEQNQKVINDK